MLMFREEKSPEDEIKAWQFWHGRQHSVKQRILDAGELCDLCMTQGRGVKLCNCIQDPRNSVISSSEVPSTRQWHMEQFYGQG